MQNKTQAEVIDIVKNNDPQEYAKFGDVAFRYANKVEEVITIIDGEEETRKTAQVGDAIITGSKGEEYTIGRDKFAARYEPLYTTASSKGIIGEARPIGKCYGAEYKGESFKFDAPWGETMICNDGDYLVSPDPEFSEAYRIEKEGFFNTYKLV